MIIDIIGVCSMISIVCVGSPVIVNKQMHKNLGFSTIVGTIVD